MKPCRYLEQLDGETYCVYWDLPLRGNEDIRCYPKGCECYEEPGGCMFEGRWMTLTEYAEYLRSKSEREIPEGYELQDFRLDSEGLAELLRSEKRHSTESMTGQFFFLKMRPEYPKAVKAGAIACLRYDTQTKPLYSAWPEDSEWVAFLCIEDGLCRAELVLTLKEEGLEFTEGYSARGGGCAGVEKVKRAILESEAFSALREDLIHELSQRKVAEPYPVDSDAVPEGGAAPWDEDADRWP